MSAVLIPGDTLAPTFFSQKAINGHDRASTSPLAVSAPPPTWRASLIFYAHDILVERALTNRQAPQTAGGMRGPISRFSRKSRTRFLLTARAVEGLCTFITLTYSREFPGDAETIRNHWARLRKWFIRRGLGGVWKREHQERGAVHFHVLVNGDIDSDELGKFWAKVSGNASAYAVDVRPITDIEGLCRYLAKDTGCAEGDGSGLRFWGTFGGAKPVVVEQVVGTLHDLAPLLRVARRLDTRLRAATGLRARHDDGRRRRILWDTSSALRKHLPRLLALYGLDENGTRPEDAGRALPEDADLKRCPDCGKHKPHEEFHQDRSQTDGLHQYCKPCKHARNAGHYDRNRFDYLARNFNQKAARLGVEGRVTGPELEAIYNEAGGYCLRCNSPENPHFDHVNAFTFGGPNTAGNIQLLCQTCSLRKGRKLLDFRGAAERYRPQQGNLKNAANSIA